MADVAVDSEVAAAMAQAESSFGRLDIAAAVAGIGGALKPLLEFETAEFEWVTRVNVLAPGAVPVPNDPPLEEGTALHDAWMRNTPLPLRGAC